MASVNPGVYKKVLRVRQAYPFDIACLLMRFFGSMLNIGVVTMLTLAGYSFLAAGLVSSTIALSIFLIGPRVSKRIDERGQCTVIPWASGIALAGMVLLLANVLVRGPVWPFFIGAALVGFYPSPQALARARWTYLIRSGRLGARAPELRTMFSYESVLDDTSFIISPSVSIALAASIHPIAGMLAGALALAVGSAILCAARSTAPVPGYAGRGEGEEGEGAAGAAGDAGAADGAGSANGPGNANGAEAADGAGSLFRVSPVIRVLFFIYVFMGAFLGLFDTATVSLAEDLQAPDIASFVLIIQGIMSMCSGVAFGMITLRRPLAQQLAVAACAVGLGFGTMFFIDSAASLAIVGLIGAATYAPLLIVANTVCERAVPQRRLTEAITWLNAGFTCGAAVGPSLGGAVIDALGTLASFKVGTVLALGMAVVGFSTYGIVKRNLRAGYVKAERREL